VTKADIIDAVFEKVGGFSKEEAGDAVETVFETVKETLEKGEKIKVSGTQEEEQESSRLFVEKDVVFMKAQ